MVKVNLHKNKKSKFSNFCYRIENFCIYCLSFLGTIVIIVFIFSRPEELAKNTYLHWVFGISLLPIIVILFIRIILTPYEQWKADKEKYDTQEKVNKELFNKWP